MLRDNGTVWDSFSREGAKKFLWGDKFGVDHPSRTAVRDWIKKNYPEKPTLLDIPCGAGVDVEVLKDIVEYHGMDKTKVFMATFRDMFPDLKASIGDIREIPCKDEAFDIVYARAIFEHLCDVEDTRLAMKECFRVAKEACIFSFFVPLSNKETIDWNGKYYRNIYKKQDIIDIIDDLEPESVEHQFVEVDDKFEDSYDIFYVKK